MEMTNGEIIRMYRHARDKGAQIKILAELNRTSGIKIIEILSKEGEEVRIPLPSRGKKRTGELPEKEYCAALMKRMEELDAKIAHLEMEYREVAAAVKSWR